MMGHFVRCRQPYVYLEVVEQSVRHHSGHEVLLKIVYLSQHYLVNMDVCMSLLTSS